MLKREDLEKREMEWLSPYACKSVNSRGRAVFEEPCEFRTDFQRDRDRIVHSKAFRRLMHKTQVFLAPEGDHYRTRLTHTLEVCQIGRTVARALNLNEDLVEAISLGHDLGHTPFGHNGEYILDEIHEGGFHHNVQSLRVCDVLESTQNRKGMNLTAEVRDGIINHSGKNIPFTLEGKIVRICDRIAYINHDIDDALRSGVINISDIPKSSLELFGYSHGARINNMIVDLVENSDGKNDIIQSAEYKEEMDALRSFMFANVYTNDKVKKESDLIRVETIIKFLYGYFIENPSALPKDLYEISKEEGTNIAVKDYIAGMTDRFAINLYNQLAQK